MLRKNIFEGDSYFAQFAQVTYKRLMSRKWVTNADIMADYLGLKSASELSCSISKCDHVKELTKSLMDIKKLIGQDSFEEERVGQSKRLRYIGKDDDPLAEMRNAKVISDLKQYWQFCQDSAGFFPSSWLEYFFQGSRDLLDIKSKRRSGEQVLSASLDRMLTNIEMLPSLYEAIIHKQVLSVVYKPYDEEERTLTFHPHYMNDKNNHPHEVKPLRVRAHNIYMYRLTETKKIHSC